MGVGDRRARRDGERMQPWLPSGGGAAAIAREIRAQSAAILAEWEGLVRERIPAARDVDHDHLIDNTPELLDRVAAMVEQIAGGHTVQLPTDIGEIHALNRLAAGFDLGDVVLEYALLRQCLLRRLPDLAGPHHDAVVIMNQAVDHSVSISVERYSVERERTLQALVSELHTERARLAAVLDQMPAAVLIAEAPSGRLVAGNRKLEEIWGRPLRPTATVDEYEHYEAFEPATGRRIADEEWALARAVQHGELVLDQELEIVRDDGTRRFISNNAAPIRDETGAVTGAVAVFYDITAQKGLTRERQQLLEEVQRAEHTHRFLSEASRRLAESIDYEKTLRRISELAVPEIADWCAVDLVEGRALRRVSVSHVDPQKVAMAREVARRWPPDPDAPHGVPQVIRTGETAWAAEITDDILTTIARDEDHLRILRDLGLRSVIIAPMVARGRVLGALTLVVAESGRRYGAADVAMAEDLARRAAMAVDNARLHREAQEAVRLREHVLAIVSHDLRNPLASVSLSASLLARLVSDGGDERANHPVEVIQRATRRMDRLISDLLDLAGIQGERLSMVPQPVDLVEVLGEALDAMAPLARAANVTLRRALPEGPVPAKADRQRLIQALSNLVGNAVRFSRPRDAVEVRLDVRERDVLVTVSDTGPGIPEDEVTRVFDPYWTAMRQGKAGTGLGLYITKGIVEAHGGTIAVDSRPGEGARFSFTLPRDVPA